MKRYSYSVGLILLLMISGFGAFNFFVDPLLLYHHRDGDDSALNRVDQFDNMRFSKPQHILYRKPEAVIIGSSRSGTITPMHESWAGLNSYNFSLPGITLNEINRSVRHAHANRPLEKLMIGLDYQAVVSKLPTSRAGFKGQRLVKDSAGFHSLPYLHQQLLDLQESLFSLDIFGESLSALASQGPRTRAYSTDGSWRSITTQLTGRGGYIYSASNTLKTREVTEFDPETNLAILEDLLRFCYSNNIETRLFLTPTHVFVVDLWFHLASEELWRNTHHQILNMNAELAREYNQPAFGIRGFGHEKSVTDEPIYRSRDIEKAWFDDGIHYRAKMARGLMKSVWSPDTDFGQQLTPDNIDAYLDSIDILRREFMRDNSDLVKDLHTRIGLQR